MILAPLWIVFIGSIALGGAIDDALARKPVWYVVCGILAGIVCALFVAVSFNLLRYGGSGPMLIVLAIGSGAWLTYETVLDISSQLRKKNAKSPATLVAATALGLLYFPALVLGATHGWGLLG